MWFKFQIAFRRPAFRVEILNAILQELPKVTLHNPIYAEYVKNINIFLPEKSIAMGELCFLCWRFSSIL
jgi:hypothetical protein